MAITQLEKVGFFSPIDRVLYGREYRVQSWVRQGFEQLITREEPIEKEDALLINFETTFSLFRLRERRIRGHSSAFSSSFNTSDAVRQTFKAELEEIMKDEAACRTVEQDIVFEQPTLSSKRPAEDLSEEPGDVFGAVMATSVTFKKKKKK